MIQSQLRCGSCTTGAEGAAIQTTVGGLRDALPGVGRPIVIAPVKYITYQASHSSEPIDGTTNPIISVFAKREVFSHEREVRAVIDYVQDVSSRLQPTPDGIAPVISSEFSGNEEGENLPVDLNVLVDRIVVSPDYPHWALSVVQDAVDSAGLRIRVEEPGIYKDTPRKS